jgi:hypothetical protein
MPVTVCCGRWPALSAVRPPNGWTVAPIGVLPIDERKGVVVAGTALRIAHLADALAAVLPAVEARFAVDGIDDLERQVLDDLRGCAVEAEEECGLVTYALGLFRAKPTNRRMREMRADLEAVGVLAKTG